MNEREESVDAVSVLRSKQTFRFFIRWRKTGMTEGDPVCKGFINQISFSDTASSIDSYQFCTVSVIQLVQRVGQAGRFSTVGYSREGVCKTIC